MAEQLEVVKFRDLIEVQSIPRLVPGVEKPTIELKGQDFRNVERILINETEVDQFIIINQYTIYAQLPDAMGKISTVEVISSNFTKTTTASKLEFSIGNKTKTISGILKLTQLFVKWLLQSPGSDIQNPNRGGGLQELIGQVTDSRRMDGIVSIMTRSIQNTVGQIRSAQINVPNLPLSERLLSAELIDFDTYAEQMEIRARIQLISLAGDDAVTSLEL